MEIILDRLNSLIYLKTKYIHQLENKDKIKNSETWKLKSLTKSYQILKELEVDNIIDIEKLKKTKGIGDGIIKRIIEITNTGTLKEIEELESKLKIVDDFNNSNNINSNELEKLINIPGIGEVKAKKLLDKKITFEILFKVSNEFHSKNFKQNEILKELTYSQFIGIKYYQDLSNRIPRGEIDDFNLLLNTLFNKIDKEIKYEICGSYRREKMDSGDIDILFTHPKLKTKDDIEKNEVHYMKLIIKKLKKLNIIVDDITKNGDLKYMGVIKVPNYNLHRHLDIKFVPYHSYIPALLHFTGSYQENIRLRQIGKEKGYKINEYGIYKLTTNNNHNNNHNFIKEELLTLHSEKELYQILEEPYKLPKDR